MRQAHAVNLGGVLHRLARGHRGRAADAVFGVHHIVDVVVQGGWVHVGAALEVAEGEEDIVIALAGEPAHLVGGHYQVGYHQRVVVYVICTDVQQPGNLVQGGLEVLYGLA